MAKRMPWKRVIFVAIPVLALAAAAVVFWPRSATTPRSQWKDAAVVEIAKLSEDRTRIELRKRDVSTMTSGQLWNGGWVADQIAIMRDGQWIAFKNHCRKESRHAGGPDIEDIFLGRGSDGKWYYSTYHFCVGMASLMSDGQPASLDEFKVNYSLREFDGRSDEALKKTWPPT